MNNKNIKWYLFAVVIVSVVLRFYNLQVKSLWQDEQWTYVIANRDWSGIIAYLKDMADRAPLHPFLTHLSLQYGDGEFNLRFFSAIFGIMGVFGIYLLGKALFSYREGIVAAVLLSLSSYHMIYSQEATAYSIFIFFSILSIYSFYIAMHETTSVYKWLLFIITSTLNLYSSYFALFLLTGLALSAITMRLGGYIVKITDSGNDITEDNAPVISLKLFLKFCICGVIIIILYIPWIPVIYSSFTKYKGAVDSTWVKVTPFMILDIFRDFSGRNNFLLWVYIAASVSGIAMTYKQYIKNYLMIFWIISAPFLIIFIITPRYNFASRYAIFILPLFIILAAKGLLYIADAVSSRLNIKNTYTAAALIICMAGLNIPSLSKHYSLEKRAWRSVTSFIEAEGKTGDIVVIEPAFLYYPFFYYLDIDKDKRDYLIDPLHQAPLVTLDIKGSGERLSVAHFMTIMKPGILNNYKRVWYLVSAGAKPDWVKKRAISSKVFQGADEGWDITLYLMEADKL